MKKKLTNGEKREISLRYLYRNLKRCGKIKKDMTFKQFRGVKVISLNTPSVQRGVKEGEKPELAIGDCYQWPKRKKRVSGQPTKKHRRAARKSLRSRVTQLIQKAKKARRERRKAYHEKKKQKNLSKVKSRKAVSKLSK